MKARMAMAGAKSTTGTTGWTRVKRSRKSFSNILGEALRRSDRRMAKAYRLAWRASLAMFGRSMVRLGTGVFITMAPYAAPAAAAERIGTPVTAVESGDVSLRVQDTTSGGVCLDLTAGSEQRRDTICSRPSTRARDDLRPRTLVLADSTIVYGAVSRGTAILELTLSRGRPVRLLTGRGEDD